MIENLVMNCFYVVKLWKIFFYVICIGLCKSWGRLFWSWLLLCKRYVYLDIVFENIWMERIDYYIFIKIVIFIFIYWIRNVVMNFYGLDFVCVYIYVYE